MYTDTVPINLSVRWPLPATLKVGPTRLLCFILLVYAHQAIRLHVSQPKPQTQLQKPSLPAVQRKLCDAFPHIATTNALGRSFECAATNNLLGCHSTIIGGQSQRITVVKTDDFSSVSTTRTEVIGGYMNAYGVQIRFQATDLQRITATVSAKKYLRCCLVIMWQHEQTPTAASTSSPGAATFATTISQPNAAQTQTPPPQHALSAGAKAGIGVGAALAVCVGLVLIWLGWRCTKRRSVPSAESVPSAQVAQNEGKKDGEPQEIDREVWFPEMQGAALFEAPGNNLHQEVGGHPIAHLHELEGRRR